MSEEILHVLKKTAKINKKTKELIEPNDHFDFFTKMNAIPAENRLQTVALLLIALVVIAVNSLIGLHDQTVSEIQLYLYSHYGGDGEWTSPLLQSLMASGTAGASV